MTPQTQQLFLEAYRAHLKAVKQAWAEVDVDDLVEGLETDDPRQGGQGCQGCGEGFNTYGTVGTFGSVGTIGGTGGTFGTFGTAACHVTEPETDDTDTPRTYDGHEST